MIQALPARIRKVLAVIRRTSQLVKPGRRLTISRDESDNRFYECAEAGAADLLITGNAIHFPVHHNTTKIVTRENSLSSLAPPLPAAIEYPREDHSDLQSPPGRKSSCFGSHGRASPGELQQP